MPINRVTIVANLCRDPELRGLPSGGSVCSMRVAVNGKRKDQSGQWVDDPGYYNVSVFGNSADATAKHLSKGSQVAIDGRLRWREWQDQQGNKRESIEIVAQEVQFIGSKPEESYAKTMHDRMAGQSKGWGPGAQQPIGDFGAPPAAPQQGPHTSPDDDIGF